MRNKSICKHVTLKCSPVWSPEYQGPPRAQHTHHLTNRRYRVGQVLQDSVLAHCIESGVRKGQSIGVTNL